MAIKYSLAHLTVLGIAPPEMAYVASRAGYDYISIGPMGYAFPRGVDPKIRDRMEQAFAIASKDPEVLDQLAKLGVAPSFRTGAAFHKYMKDMEPLFIQVLTESGMKTR